MIRLRDRHFLVSEWKQLPGWDIPRFGDVARGHSLTESRAASTVLPWETLHLSALLSQRFSTANSSYETAHRLSLVFIRWNALFPGPGVSELGGMLYQWSILQLWMRAFNRRSVKQWCDGQKNWIWQILNTFFLFIVWGGKGFIVIIAVFFLFFPSSFGWMFS